MMSFFLDSLIVFLLIYAVIDLSHRALDYLTSLWFKDEEKAGILLLRLATLSPDNAEEILRRATKSGYSLWLLTDDAPHHILFMAEAICQSANDV